MTEIVSRRDLTFDQWLAKFPRSKDSYYAGVKAFLCGINDIQPEHNKPDISELRKLASAYIAEARAHRDVLGDIQRFIQNFDKSGMTLEVYLWGIRSFLNYTCDLQLPRETYKELKTLMPKGMGQPAITNEVMTTDTWRDLIINAPVRMKANLLFGIASGIRPGEILQLKLDDVKLEQPENYKGAWAPTVFVRPQYTKDGRGYITCITSEAAQALKDWLKVRESYMDSEKWRNAEVTHRANFQAMTKSHANEAKHTSPARPPARDDLFPFTYQNASVASSFETSVPKDGRVKIPAGIFAYEARLHGEWDGQTLTLHLVK